LNGVFSVGHNGYPWRRAQRHPVPNGVYASAVVGWATVSGIQEARRYFLELRVLGWSETKLLIRSLDEGVLRQDRFI